jgi:hypothetical protein
LFYAVAWKKQSSVTEKYEHRVGNGCHDGFDVILPYAVFIPTKALYSQTEPIHVATNAQKHIFRITSRE